MQTSWSRAAGRVVERQALVSPADPLRQQHPGRRRARFGGCPPVEAPVPSRGRQAGRQKPLAAQSPTPAAAAAGASPPTESRRPAAAAMGEHQLKALQEEADGVKDIMLENYNKVLDREGKLTELDQRADDLRNQSSAFSKTTQTLAWKKRWENMKWKIILGVGVAVIMVVLLAIILYFAIPRPGSQDAPAQGADGGN
ncbi:vesicle-associated membrane protein 5 [Hemicordylus capensis]|uniref:vesicle-associated membrane protein 5 n=1 Tax=Hemicordylus capensis TaxID=884348 RepID=UPI002303367E|nr:vesicle-associated membrane protein 5 [Hemicordylus capensis]